MLFIVITLVVVLGSYLFLGLVLPRWFFPLEEGYVSSKEQGITRLITDIVLAQESILISCTRCDAGRFASYDLADRLRRAFIERDNAGVDIHIIIAEPPPAFLKELENQGVLKIHRPSGSLPFYGRVIDWQLVERYESEMPDIYGVGKYFRAPNAHEDAALLTQKAFAK